MKISLILRQRSRIRTVAIAVLAIALITTTLTTALPVSGQAAVTRADAVVLVNSTSPTYADFARYIRPYLDHFGVPYVIVDIATTAVPANLQDYALIIIGHNRLDPQHTYLDAAEQLAISSAVNLGTGLLNFDSVLADSSFAPYYQYIQSVFGFGYAPATSSSSVTINSSPTLADYVVAAQPTNASYNLLATITPLRVTLDPQAATLANIGTQPLLVAKTYGLGRAVQWTSYDWMRADVWGYAHGFDDLIWRSIVWAARKPFVMQGLPPFVTMRVDDVTGPFWWVDTANQYGLKPWGGLFYTQVQDIPHLKSLVDAGDMTVSIHARSSSGFFYWNYDAGANFSDQTVAQYFAEGTAWHTNNQIPISKYVVPHFYAVGTNVFDRLRNWGVEFIGTVMAPGNYYGGSRLMMGPFNRYETTCSSDCNAPYYYADYLTVPGHPEFDGQFFNLVTEIRDITGYEWYPGNDVNTTINNGVAQLKRALNGMELATLFTHEYYIQSISSSNWTTILSNVISGVGSYNPEYVTLDYAAQYIRAKHNSKLISSIYDPQAQLLSTTLTGSTDIATRFYLFTESGGAIQHTFVSVPVFSGNVVVNHPLQGPTPTSTSTPGPSPTPTNTPTVTPTPTNTPVGPTPTNTPTPMPGESTQINVYEDAHQLPVLATTTNVGELVATDNQWTEFLYEPRGYPGVFAGNTERPPVMRFYGAVPNGTYTLIANLYHNANLRYYWGYSAATPEQFSFDVTTGPAGDFQEYTLGTVTVSNGLFELYIDRADLLSGSYPYWGWAWIRLVGSASTPTPTPVPTDTPVGPTPTNTPTNTPTPTDTPVGPTATNTPTPTQTPTSTPTDMPTVTPTPTNTSVAPTATYTPTPTATPNVSLQINVYDDAYQQPILATTTNAGDLNATDNQWTEFLYGPRGYAGVFAGTTERPPVMRFYGAVPNGTYTLIANLYHNANLRYYWGYSAATPEQFSFDVTTGPAGDFQEYTLGTVTVSNGVFELYIDRADALSGSYPYWGWAWIRLVGTSTPTNTPTATATPTNTPVGPTATNTPTPTPTPTSTPTNSPTVTPTPTNTPSGPMPTNTPTPTAAPTNTGLLSPSSNAVQSGGDNNGFQTSPINAYGSNSLFAVDTNSGTSTSTSCTNSGKDRHAFYTYNINVPANAVVLGIEVRADARVDSTTGLPRMCVQLSWDGGVTWTAAKTTATLSATPGTYTLGSATDTWGRTWTVNDRSNTNFRVRVTNIASSTARDFSLDWLAVRVTYQP